MRIAYTLEQCWHRVPGGTAVAALETLRALTRSSDLDLIGVSARHRRAPERAWSPQRWCPGVTVAALSLPRRVLYESWHTLRWPPVDAVTGPVDVIHATGLAVPPPTAPLVCTWHDLAFEHEPSWFSANGRRFFAAALRRAREDAAFVLCPSQATAADLEAAGFETERIRIVPLATSSRPVPDRSVAAVRGRYGLVKPYVLWTGTLEPRKNLSRLLGAFASLAHHDIELVLVGPRGWGPDLGAVVAPVAERVRRLGFVDQGDLDALYAGAEVFCYPSLLEGFGLPVVEAMVQSTPVVTSAGTATEEVVGGGGLTVDPHDVDAIAAAVDRVLTDSALATALGDAGRTRAGELSWEHTAALVETAYRDAVAR